MGDTVRGRRGKTRAYREPVTAAAVAGSTRMTAEQLMDLSDLEARHELVDGELKTLPFTDGQHGQVAGNVSVLLGRHLTERHLGQCYAAGTGIIVRRDPDTVLSPDFSFVPGRSSGRRPDWFVEAVPDLVVEVVADRDRAAELTERTLIWLDHGVRLVWVIHPNSRLVTVHRPGVDVIGLVRGEQSVLNGGDVLPGFSVPLAEIFS